MKKPSLPQNNSIPYYKSHPDLIICFLIVILIFITYTQTLGFDFVWDDIRISQNPNIDAGITAEGIKWAFKLRNGLTYWHPFSWISHMLDIQIFGMNPAGHHLSNILIHAANCLLLFTLLRLMTGSLWRSTLVTTLFALHPLNVESVAWIAERKNVLSTFWGLLTILSYYRYTQQKGKYIYPVVILLFSMSLLTKPMLITLPIILLLLDFWPLKRYKTKRTGQDSAQGSNRYHFLGSDAKILSILFLEKVPLLVCSYLSYRMTSISMAEIAPNKSLFVSTHSVPLLLRIENIFVSLVNYLRDLFLPINLGCFYPMPDTLPLWEVIVSLALLIAITFLVIRFYPKRPNLLIGWFWFCISIAPVSGIIRIGAYPARADRFTYFPFIGLFIILSWGIYDLLGKRPKIKFLIITLIISIYCMTLTMHQMQYWKNEVSLYSRAIKVTSKDNVYMRMNLSQAVTNEGIILLSQDKVDASINKFKSAIIINSKNESSFNGLGVALSKKGHDEAAIYYLEKAIEIDPDYQLAHYNLGILFSKNKNYEKSLIHFTKVLQLDPNNESSVKYVKKALSMINK